MKPRFVDELGAYAGIAVGLGFVVCAEALDGIGLIFGAVPRALVRIYNIAGAPFAIPPYESQR